MEGRQEERDRLRAERQAAESSDAASTQRQKRRTQLLIIAGFAAVAVIVALIVISQSGGGNGGGGTPSNVQGADQVSSELNGISQSGQVLGDSSAPITIVEFGDPQCPVCKAFSEQVAPTLISTYVKPGQAKYEYRPWDIIGPQSPDASKAALAAGEQDRFWNYIQLFYLNQGEENSGYVTDSFLESIAKGAGVPDIAKWNTDRQSSKWDSILSKNDSDAGSLGFSGTPSILIEGPKGQKALSGFSLGEIEDAIKQQQG
jgi:protein-disulfide isomerase